MGYLSGLPNIVPKISPIWGIVWSNHVAHSKGQDFGCNMTILVDQIGGVFEWPTGMGGILGAILVNQVV